MNSSNNSTPLDNGVFKTKVNSGAITYGTFLGLASPVAAEICALAGLDWLLLDLEHGAGGEEQVGPTVVAAGAYGVPVLVRVESLERIRIGRVLDAGAAGIMVPRVENLSQVKEVIKHMSTPPYGDRGVATYNRSARWGRDLEFLNGPSKLACIVQIETIEALESVGQIAALDEVDVLFIGPADLSFALGVPRDFKNTKFIEALNKVLAACKKNNKAAGILAFSPESAIEYREMGFNFIAVNSDSTFLAGVIETTLKKIK